MTAQKAPETIPVPPNRKPRGRGRPASVDISGVQFREVILEAAAGVYAAHGFHGTSVQSILIAAGVSRPTFYRYFSDRYEVLDIVIGRVNEKLRVLIETAVTETDDVELILQSVVEAYFTWGDAIGPMAGPIYKEMHDTASPASAHRSRMLHELLQLFTRRANDGLNVINEPLLFEASIHVVEHLGHTTFWPKKLKANVSRHRKKIIIEALRGMLLSQEQTT